MKLRSFAILAALAIVAGQAAAVSAAFIDITRPGDTIQLVNGFNQGDANAGPPPGAEGVENAINDIGQKYLNFLDLSSGFDVTPSFNIGPVVGVRLYTANDAPERDPASFQLFGSNVGIDGPYEAIASGALMLPAGRNAGGNAVAIPPAGNLGAIHQEILFDNSVQYDHYRLVFPTLKDAVAANSMQIAEVELLAVPEPASIALVLFGALGVMGIVRRR